MIRLLEVELNMLNQFTGDIDQVRIYDSAVSAADVSTLYKEVECEPAAINALDHFNTVTYVDLVL